MAVTKNVFFHLMTSFSTFCARNFTLFYTAWWFHGQVLRDRRVNLEFYTPPVSPFKKSMEHYILYILLYTQNIVFEHYVWYSVGNFLLIFEVSAQTVQPLWSALDFCNPCFCVNNGNFRVKKSMEHYILYILLYTQNIVFEHYVWYSVGNFLLIFEVSAQTVQPLWSALDFCNPCF